LETTRGMKGTFNVLLQPLQALEVSTTGSFTSSETIHNGKECEDKDQAEMRCCESKVKVQKDTSTKYSRGSKVCLKVLQLTNMSEQHVLLLLSANI